MGRPGSGAPPRPTIRPLGRAVGAYYPLAVGVGGAGVGTCQQPHSARSCELALCAVGAARGRPGGAPLAWVWGVRGRALSHPRPLVLTGVRPGPTTHWLWVLGAWAWGPVTQRTACALASWLWALWRRHEGARGGRLLPGCGASGDERSPTPDRSSFGACGRGSLHTGCGCGGCGCADPSPTDSARSWELALCAMGAARGRPGGAPLAWVLGVWGRALSHPRPLVLWGVLPGPSTHWLWVRGVWAWVAVTNPLRALLGAGFARCGGGTRAPGGGASCLGVGRPGSGALPPPTARPWGRAAGAHYPLAVGAGGVDVATRHQPHSALSCELALRAVGEARGRPGGGVSCLGVGRPGTKFSKSSFNSLLCLSCCLLLV